MIRDKSDLITWLKENDLYSDTLDVPEVKPYKKSKWQDFEDDPEWLSDNVFAQVPIHFNEAIGGNISCVMDVQYQDDAVRVKLMRTRMGRFYYTQIKKLGEAQIKLADYEKCNSAADLIERINDQLPHKLMVERQ